MLLELVELAREADTDVTYTNVLPEKVGHLVARPGTLLSFKSFYDASPAPFRAGHIGTDVRVSVQTFADETQC